MAPVVEAGDPEPVEVAAADPVLELEEVEEGMANSKISQSAIPLLT